MQSTFETVKRKKREAYLASRAVSQDSVSEGRKFAAEKATDGTVSNIGHIKRKSFDRQGSALEGIFGRVADWVMYAVDELARVTNAIQETLTTSQSDARFSALGIAPTPDSLDSLKQRFHVAEQFVSEDAIQRLEQIDVYNTVAKRTFDDVLDGTFVGPPTKAFNDAITQASTPAERVDVAHEFFLSDFVDGVHKIDGAFAISADRMVNLRGSFGIENGSSAIYVFSPRQTVVTPQLEISAQTNQPVPVYAPAPGLFSGR